MHLLTFARSLYSGRRVEVSNIHADTAAAVSIHHPPPVCVLPSSVTCTREKIQQRGLVFGGGDVAIGRPIKAVRLRAPACEKHAYAVPESVASLRENRRRPSRRSVATRSLNAVLVKEEESVHLDTSTVENRGQQGPGGSLSLLGESRVATNIRGFFATRIGSALPDTG
ncbi:hypothetical protein QE152_g25600 [Popillia japonica]|uniref:Uncharacterized protein n=1 Tax=Popillia japonica TaxID=7064 RepID=A0AAW1K1C9_POPJA